MARRKEFGLELDMRCPKCGTENSDKVQFCTRCHTTLRYICPACQHDQAQGGKCEKCGVDFAKYVMMLQFQAKAEADRERERVRGRTSIIKQIVLLPITGGFSLFKFIRSRLLGD